LESAKKVTGAVGNAKTKAKDRKKNKEVSTILAGGEWDAMLNFNHLNFDSTFLKNSFYELTHLEKILIKQVYHCMI
jgi:hypothetical protein